MSYSYSCFEPTKKSNVYWLVNWHGCVWSSDIFLIVGIPNRIEVWRIRWWMAAYGARTPKRHVGWSNSANVGVLHGGKLKFDYKNPLYQSYKTTKKTISKAGKKQFSGRKAQLRESGYPGWTFTCIIFQLFFCPCGIFVKYLYILKHPNPQKSYKFQGIILTALVFIFYENYHTWDRVSSAHSHHHLKGSMHWSAILSNLSMIGGKMQIFSVC